MNNNRIACGAPLGSFDGDTDGQARWVHVAVEGTYLGYRGGAQPFAFTRQSFEQAVTNIHTHPAYRAGPAGEGVADVIPWDFNHASESNPTEGELPTAGAPSQGWTRDLKIVDANGKAHLYALTRFLEPARSYVKAGQYKWSSVAATFNGIDPITGQSVGMVITSIALTNTPFIEGMEQLAASKRGTQVQAYPHPHTPPIETLRLSASPETAFEIAAAIVSLGAAMEALLKILGPTVAARFTHEERIQAARKLMALSRDQSTRLALRAARGPVVALSLFPGKTALARAATYLSLFDKAYQSLPDWDSKFIAACTWLRANNTI